MHLSDTLGEPKAEPQAATAAVKSWLQERELTGSAITSEKDRKASQSVSLGTPIAILNIDSRLSYSEQPHPPTPHLTPHFADPFSKLGFDCCTSEWETEESLEDLGPLFTRIFYCVFSRPESLIAHLGEHAITSEEGTEQHIQVEKAIPFPEYNSYLYDQDFMLLKLSKPVTFNAFVQPIEINPSCPVAGEQCLVSGWGNLLTNGGK